MHPRTFRCDKICRYVVMNWKISQCSEKYIIEIFHCNWGCHRTFLSVERIGYIIIGHRKTAKHLIVTFTLPVYSSLAKRGDQHRPIILCPMSVRIWCHHVRPSVGRPLQVPDPSIDRGHPVRAEMPRWTLLHLLPPAPLS